MHINSILLIKSNNNNCICLKTKNKNRKIFISDFTYFHYLL